MKRRKLLLASVLCVLTVGLSGCGDAIPELTESEQQAITDYAVDLVLKYDKNYQSRLVELTPEELLETPAPAPTPTPVPEVSEGMGPVDKLPETMVGESGVNSLSAEEVLGWNGMYQLRYEDFQLTDSYETSSPEQGYVSVEASAGNTLLVARFSLNNVSAVEQHINMLAYDADFSLKVDSEPVKQCQITLLENDLSTYFGDIPANGTVEVVLIAEMAEDSVKDVASLTLNVENEEKIATIQLF